MNRYITIGFGLVVIIGIIALILLMHPGQSVQTGTATPNGAPTTPVSNYTVTSTASAQTAHAVLAAFNASLAAQNPDNIKAQTTAVVDTWALQAWSGSYASGQALLHYDAVQGKWLVVSNGGGVWNVAELVQLGVPKKSVLILLSDLYKSH